MWYLFFYNELRAKKENFLDLVPKYAWCVQILLRPSSPSILILSYWSCICTRPLTTAVPTRRTKKYLHASGTELKFVRMVNPRFHFEVFKTNIYRWKTTAWGLTLRDRNELNNRVRVKPTSGPLAVGIWQHWRCSTCRKLLSVAFAPLPKFQPNHVLTALRSPLTADP